MWKIACAALLLFRNPGRHHLGMPGRLRRNPQLKGKSVMRTLVASAGLALLLALATEPSVSAQEPPAWMKQTLPDHLLKPHWDEQLAVMNPKSFGRENQATHWPCCGSTNSLCILRLRSH